jgi:membrane-associated phospholipid phosphatase
MVAVISVVVTTGVAGCERDRSSTEAMNGVRAEPDAGTWATWVLSSPDEVKVPPPPTRGTVQAEADAAQLRRFDASPGPEVEDLVRRWNADPVMRPWIDLALDSVSTRPADAPAGARAYALVSVAIDDAVVTTWHWKYVYGRKAPSTPGRLSSPGPDPSYPSEHAAIAAAASRVLGYLFPERSAASLDELAEEAGLSRIWAGANFASDVNAGLALGRDVAARVIHRARSDGSDRRWDGSRPPLTPQYWQPPPGVNSPPLQPLAGSWRPWVLQSGAQVRPNPPPPYGSPQFLAEAREVMDVKARLTPEQMAIARLWGGGEGTALPPGIWNRMALSYVQRSDMSTPQAARALGLLNVALGDAAIAVWHAKYTWWSPRPENSIRDLGLDPDWKPALRTPPFPSYVSGHATFSGAASEVLSYLFPAHADVFRAKAEEAALSRLYGGIHFRSDNEVGLSVGRRVGGLVLQRAHRDGYKG